MDQKGIQTCIYRYIPKMAVFVVRKDQKIIIITISRGF